MAETVKRGVHVSDVRAGGNLIVISTGGARIDNVHVEGDIVAIAATPVEGEMVEVQPLPRARVRVRRRVRAFFLWLRQLLARVVQR